MSGNSLGLGAMKFVDGTHQGLEFFRIRLIHRQFIQSLGHCIFRLSQFRDCQVPSSRERIYVAKGLRRVVCSFSSSGSEPKYASEKEAMSSHLMWVNKTSVGLSQAV